MKASQSLAVGVAVTVLGIMAGPVMVRTGYDAKLSAGAIAAGGTLGILIPPSVMLVVVGPTIGVPVNMLYSSAIGPGLLLEERHAAMESFDDLPRHGAIHGDPDHLSFGDHCVAGTRALAAENAQMNGRDWLCAKH
ncbi:MAG: TRAP transporter large permease subunit [Betaproteobacteria bacterium]